MAATRLGTAQQFTRAEDCCCETTTSCNICGEGLSSIAGLTAMTITRADLPLGQWFVEEGLTVPFTTTAGVSYIGRFYCGVNGSFTLNVFCDATGKICVFGSTSDMTFTDCVTTVVAEDFQCPGCTSGLAETISLSNVVCDGIGLVSFDFALNSPQGIIEGTFSR